MKLTTAVCAALTPILLAISSPGSALPIPVSGGESVTFNFDFAAASVSPSPPYSLVNFYANMLEYDLGDIGTWQWYDGLDATGTVVFSWGLLDSLQSGGTGVIDGVFSARLTMTSGMVTVEPTARGLLFTQQPPFLEETPLIYPSVVTEPSSITLLGLGALALGLSRRQRRTRAANP